MRKDKSNFVVLKFSELRNSDVKISGRPEKFGQFDVCDNFI